MALYIHNAMPCKSRNSLDIGNRGQDYEQEEGRDLTEEQSVIPLSK